VIAVLMQASKGGGLAGAFGGIGSSAVFGGRQAASFLSKATVYLAVAFMLNCIVLAILSKSTTQPRSVTQQEVTRSPAGSLPMAPQTESPTPSGSGENPSGEGSSTP